VTHPRDAENQAATTPLTGSFVDALRHARSDERRVALVVYHRGGAERVLLSPGIPVTIGRAPPSQVRIADDSLSREHARFTRAERAVVVEDLRSTNGTWTGGVRVDRSELSPGDEVMLGNVLVSVRALTEEEHGMPGLMSHERFRVALEDEVVRSRHFGRSFAVLMIRAAAHRARGAHVSRIAPRVRALLRPVDRLALYGSDVIAVVLVETGPEAALELARALTASPADEGEDALVIGVASFPGAATTAEKLLEVCWSALRSATPASPVEAAPLGTWTSGRTDRGDEPVVVSPAMVRVYSTVTRLARSPIPVLLLGETGTGKEIVARAIHERSPRRARPMVCVNCGAIPSQLVESTLFGHERGAFTGAGQQQRGLFEAADGGTVLLDEIGELPPAAQAALLRVLETRRVVRVGSSREIDVDARVVAATHRDLEAMCASGSFRLDLLYRLNAMTLTIPPLRARPEEIEPLALRFLQQANRANGLALRGIEAGALALLRGYAWPGNARELRNAIERAVIVAEGAWITDRDLPERVSGGGAVEPAAKREAALDGEEPAAEAGGGADGFRARLQRCEAEIIVQALRDAGWNQTEAALALGMPLRTLVHKLKTLGIKKLGFAPTKDAPSRA
jgi:two-component system, NtrC family, response regulator AtoC